MRQWKDIEPSLVKQNKALLDEFRNDYLYTFGEKINKNCGLCFIDYFYKLVKFQTKGKMKKQTEYKLKLKYNGIQFSRKGKKTIIVRQGDLTDTLAKMLIKEHPAGKDLFDFIPEPKKNSKEAKTS